MLIGLTSNQNEELRQKISRQKRIVFSFFISLLFLPFIIFLLFSVGILKSTPAFTEDIQQPVAKVITAKGTGTAFLISPTKMLTARHVVEGLMVGTSVQIVFEKTEQIRTISGKVLYIAPTKSKIEDGNVATMDYFMSDMAVIEVSQIDDITPLDMGESDAVSPLDEVILIGYPNGDYSISKGNINSDSYQGYNLFKLDATSNPGNSGGPCILRDDNTVIGILVGGAGPNYQGENIALKIAIVKSLLKTANIDISK